MSKNFVTIEESLYKELIKNKSQIDAILDCLLEKEIDKYDRFYAQELQINYIKHKYGIKEDLNIKSTDSTEDIDKE